MLEPCIMLQLSIVLQVFCLFSLYQVCKKYYKNRSSLQQHLKSHMCRFYCELCSKSFGSYSGFM